MFKLDPTPTFKAPVQLSAPGQPRPIAVDVEFRHFDIDGLKAYYEALPGKTDLDGLLEVIVSWDGFDAGFSQESLTRLLKNYPTAAGELYAAFRREHMESKVKN